MSDYKAEIYYNDNSRTEIERLHNDAKGLRKAFLKRKTIEVTGPNSYNLIDMAQVNNIRLTRITPEQAKKGN